jgi:hypothetical protein
MTKYQFLAFALLPIYFVIRSRKFGGPFVFIGLFARFFLLLRVV